MSRLPSPPSFDWTPNKTASQLPRAASDPCPFTGTIRRGVDSAAEPPDSERTPAERRQNIFRMDSKLFLRTPADSERTPADSRRTLKSAADSERLRGGPVECPPRTKPVADSTPLADSGGEVGGSAADSTADLNPAESAGLQSPLGVRGGVRRLPTESTDFQPSAKFVT